MPLVDIGASHGKSPGWERSGRKPRRTRLAPAGRRRHKNALGWGWQRIVWIDYKAGTEGLDFTHAVYRANSFYKLAII